MSAWDEPWGDRHPFAWFRDNHHHYTSETAVSIVQQSFPFEDEALPPDGVYFWVDGWQIVYVGQSTNLSFRHGSHHAVHWRFPERIFVLDVPKPFMKMVEAFYIHLLCPTINRKFPRINNEELSSLLAEYGIDEQAQVVDGVVTGDMAQILLHPDGGLIKYPPPNRPGVGVRMATA